MSILLLLILLGGADGIKGNGCFLYTTIQYTSW